MKMILQNKNGAAWDPQPAADLPPTAALKTFLSGQETQATN
jgi:hypothetical protein